MPFLECRCDSPIRKVTLVISGSPFRLFLWIRSWGGFGLRLLVFLRTRAQCSSTDDQTHQESEGEFTFHTILVV